ncbi:LOW QUALITY PROTEIN: F-box/kelch-repeat protein SKIP4-like [Primulina huaijiensis]|uniref:LOW QUALITY PROTEIN: F-box/kelch-repeat protein SKIP4-like n=1 Tax=Primulina huaijiensis TaxID=1492673 RepID=UPI003CC6FEBF
MELPSVCDNLESRSEGSGRSELSALIPGLPDDIVVSCLASVPRRYHPHLKHVSKRWRELVCSKEWVSYRLKHHLAETWIYALCINKSEELCIYMLDPNHFKRGWKLVHGLPSCFLKRKGVGFEVLGTKLFLFGGCGWVEDATSEVYFYDALTNMWSAAGCLSTPRSYFAHEALNGKIFKIFAIGGLGSKLGHTNSWDSYDPRTNCWSPHMDPNVIPHVENSLVLDGKIYVRCGSQGILSHAYAIVYEPFNETWNRVDADFISGWCGPAFVIDGVLFVLNQTLGARLMVWQKDRREWITVRRLSTLLTRPPCRLVAVGKKMLVIGKGLSTVMFDVPDIYHADRVLLSSSVPGLISVNDVISCKSLAI